MALMYSGEILKELEKAVSGIDRADTEAMEEALLRARRVFCDGLGRSGLCCKGFAMRLMHLGMTSYYVGETVTPSIREGSAPAVHRLRGVGSPDITCAESPKAWSKAGGSDRSGRIYAWKDVRCLYCHCFPTKRRDRRQNRDGSSDGLSF